MTTTEEPTLRQKLDGAIQNHLEVSRERGNVVTLRLSLHEVQSVAEMLREDEPPDTTGVLPGSYSVTLVACDTRFSVTGEGIHNRSDIPVFERESDAESMCRCLSLAYRAGQRQRSRAIKGLLDV